MLSKSIIICPSARLARAIQNDISRLKMQSGFSQWASAKVFTLLQWMESLVEEGLLTGEIGALGSKIPYALSAFNEQSLWEEVIKQSLKKNAFGELFDVSGLAKAASEANQYVIAWQLHIPREFSAEESRQFIQWQRAFQVRCNELNVLESVRYFNWQLDYLAHSLSSQQGLAKLPARVEFAGFDQTAPQEKRLRDILSQCGIEVVEYVTTQATAANAQHVSLENKESECRAAVAWAQQSLLENPNVKLAIVVPGLNEVRTQLADLLDDVFYPATVRPNHHAGLAAEKNYNFSLGLPLAQQPIVQVALNLLRVISNFRLQLTDISTMLRSPYWSASQSEADARALLDAKMREKLPLQLSLSRFITFAQKQHEAGLNIPRLLLDLQTADALATSNKLTPAQWAQYFDDVLSALHWPGERNVTSLEYQAMNAWQKALQQLAKQNLLGKTISKIEAVHLIQKICADQVFQAETEHEPSIQILGIMEALSAPVDAMWCMHMNDDIWPPPARPNALLPASIQRAAKLPNADSAVQAIFAITIHQRLMHSAHTIIFSSSKTAGESQLRVSPLMTDLIKENVNFDGDMPLANTLAEQLGHAHSLMCSQDSKLGLSLIDDHLAPPVLSGEHVSGGTGLLRAQAICPAWAFYQFRLGAKALKTPTSGLDSMGRGSLVHDVLEQFWRKRHFADLRDMSEHDLTNALDLAIHHALENFVATEHMVSATVLELEHERLSRLIGAWLQFEKARGVEFKIVACEATKKVDICGIEVTLKIDRVHQLLQGELEFIDYKTGQAPKMNSWGEDRITEPQLPIYATFYTDDLTQVAGVHFGMVKLVDHTFVGLNQADFEVESAMRKPTFIQSFAQWQHLLQHWKASIEAIALEIRQGESIVQFSDENDLKYCEVKALLRLPERKLQFERFNGGML